MTNNDGTIKRRKGYNTFGEMVHVLWELNKKAKKMGWSSEYTVKLPLKGTKPVYKKTLRKPWPTKTLLRKERGYESN